MLIAYDWYRRADEMVASYRAAVGNRHIQPGKQQIHKLTLARLGRLGLRHRLSRYSDDGRRRNLHREKHDKTWAAGFASSSITRTRPGHVSAKNCLKKPALASIHAVKRTGGGSDASATGSRVTLGTSQVRAPERQATDEAKRTQVLRAMVRGQ